MPKVLVCNYGVGGNLIGPNSRIYRKSASPGGQDCPFKVEGGLCLPEGVEPEK